jgi:hypothetical protein
VEVVVVVVVEEVKWVPVSDSAGRLECNNAARYRTQYSTSSTVPVWTVTARATRPQQLSFWARACLCLCLCLLTWLAWLAWLAWLLCLGGSWGRAVRPFRLPNSTLNLAEPLVQGMWAPTGIQMPVRITLDRDSCRGAQFRIDGCLDLIGCKGREILGSDPGMRIFSRWHSGFPSKSPSQLACIFTLESRAKSRKVIVSYLGMEPIWNMHKRYIAITSTFDRSARQWDSIC